MEEYKDLIKDFDTLINSFIEIGNQMEGEMITSDVEHLYNAEGLGKKVLNHVLTIRTLCDGYQYQSFQAQIDFSSIAVLTRAALETYLILNYLFVSPKDEDEREFKLNSWYLGGLDRVKYKPAFADNIRKWEEEVLLGDTLKSKICDTTYYKTLNPRKQKEILKGDWKLGGWFELAKKAGFDEGFFRKQYMFLSAYSHSNRLSIMQIQQVKHLSGQRDMTKAFIGITMVILAKYAYDYVQLIPSLKDKVDLSGEKYHIINLYKLIGERLTSDM